MGDYIDRQAAIKALDEIRESIWEVDILSPTIPEYIEHHLQMQDLMRRCDILLQAVKTYPSADVRDNRVGKWIPHEDEDGEHYGDCCSICGGWFVMPHEKTNFCPNCGADMRNEE